MTPKEISQYIHEFFQMTKEDIQGNYIIEYRDNNDTTRSIRWMIMMNSRNVWLSLDMPAKPPFTHAVTWDKVTNIYNKEKHPEYFL